MRTIHVYKGQSLVEVIIALAFAMVIIVALVTVTVQSMKNSTFAKNNAQATKFAQEGMEWVREKRDSTTWNDFSSSSGSYCINFLPDVWTGLNLGFCPSAAYLNKIFQRTLTLATPSDKCNNDSNQVAVTIVVEWESSDTKTHGSTLTSCFTNWQNK